MAQPRISLGRKVARALVGGAVASGALLSVAAATDSRATYAEPHGYGYAENEGCPEGWDPMFAEGDFAPADRNGDGIVCMKTVPSGVLVIDNETH